MLVLLNGVSQTVAGSVPAKPVISQALNFNVGWEFVKDIDTTVTADFFRRNAGPANSWRLVSLPHTAQPEPLVITGTQWQGTGFYRKFFTISAADKNKRLAIHFEAAMHEADVYLNGRHLLKHIGGYLPFEVDISRYATAGAENCVLVRVNNQDNPAIPPGKPIRDLDFNYYSGLYRNVYLIVDDKLHIPDAVQAGRKAAGGVLVYYSRVSPALAMVHVQTEVKNDHPTNLLTKVRLTLLDSAGRQVGLVISKEVSVRRGAYSRFSQTISVRRPRLWSPADPYRYRLLVEVLQSGRVADREELAVGIRTFRFAGDGFYLNGEKLNIRGTNRHQEYPYVGYALSDNANYRDAWQIKNAGFNFVRCSHYPPASAFLDACDELGLLVMDAIPGWQFFGDSTFQQNSLADVRGMVRRDRNHPCIILWEASLNESGMSPEYMEKAHQAVHEELPFGDVYTCGWLDSVYDVFIPARQHAKPPHYWNNYDKNKPLLIAEYGDWEYYAQNAGFNQMAFKNLKEGERSSRQLRGAGEKRMLQQALNFQEAHNDNLRGRAVGDANWLMFDYNRGYAPDLEASGIADIFRLPKFAFYFYQSQYGPVPDRRGFGKPMLLIANYWTRTSPRDITVYSNCEEVELFLNEKFLGRQKPDQNDCSTHLAHPPFTFSLPRFTAGELKAVGYLNGSAAVETTVQTPGTPQGLRLTIDRRGRDLSANDVVFVYASVVDERGTVIPDAAHSVIFRVEGDAELVGQNPISVEAGTATILLKTGAVAGLVKITAYVEGLRGAELISPVTAGR
ncbi:beta-galactosidase [Nibrella viscosa]|uniref:Beta-galactosidase n=1 Tax=Nibrella viscosa TaxID=1084524 RepID=A0ABP8KU75_9BACT